MKYCLNIFFFLPLWKIKLTGEIPFDEVFQDSLIWFYASIKNNLHLNYYDKHLSGNSKIREIISLITDSAVTLMVNMTT